MLEELQRALGLPEAPHRIEGFDISNIQGSEAVGSMVVWEDGDMKKDDYKRFKIRTVAGADDFASMAEVLRAALRARRWRTGACCPTSILLDGGRGQLERRAHASSRSWASTTSRSSRWPSARRRSTTPERLQPLVLDLASPALQTLQRIRDEAHRFAITYHKKLRTSSGPSVSVLDQIPGVGPTIRTSLLKTLGSARGCGPRWRSWPVPRSPQARPAHPRLFHPASARGNLRSRAVSRQPERR